MLVKIEAESKCIPLIARVVEMYNGRQQIFLNEDGTKTFVVVNPDKRPYAELVAWFLAEVESRKRTELYFVTWAEKRRKDFEELKRKAEGKTIAVPLKKVRT